MAGKKKMDADTMAALEVVNMDRAVERNAEAEQNQREGTIRKLYEDIGAIRTANAIQKIADVGKLVRLKQLKDEKLYKHMPEFGTWQKVCDYMEISRSKIDEDLQNLEAFGEKITADCRQLGIDYRSMRKLRKAVSEGDLVVDAEYVTIGEEKIPLTPDHTDELKEALEQIIEAKNQVIEAKDKIIEEKNDTIKAKDRVAEAKEKMIQKQEKEIAKYEGEAQKKGFKPGEEALLKKIEALRTTFDGFYITIDPEGNPMLEGDGATDRVKAAFLGLVSYMRASVQAVYDTVSLEFGVPDVDDFDLSSMKA